MHAETHVYVMVHVVYVHTHTHASMYVETHVCVLTHTCVHARMHLTMLVTYTLGQKSRKNSEIHIDVSHSRQPLVKGERLVRNEVNTVMPVECKGSRMSLDHMTSTWQ